MSEKLSALKASIVAGIVATVVGGVILNWVQGPNSVLSPLWTHLASSSAVPMWWLYILHSVLIGSVAFATYAFKHAHTLSKSTVDPQPVDPQPVDPQPVDPQPVDPQPVELKLTTLAAMNLYLDSIAPLPNTSQAMQKPYHEARIPIERVIWKLEDEIEQLTGKKPFYPLPRKVTIEEIDARRIAQGLPPIFSTERP